MLIMDPPTAWNSTARAIAGLRSEGYASPNILAYFPRMYGREDDGSPPLAVGGAIAGLLSKHDRIHGPWQEPAAGALRFSRSLVPALLLGTDEAGRLVREGLNVIGGSIAGQAALRGSVTLARNSPLDRKFARLHVQRLCLSITNALERATRWALFAAPEGRVADRLQAQVHSYMSGLAEAGAFANARFAVQCDAALHGAADPRRGITILLAFHPAGAGESVSLTLHHTVSGCRVSTTAFAPSMAQCA
jgi:phage tail sheath protein FI